MVMIIRRSWFLQVLHLVLERGHPRMILCLGCFKPLVWIDLHERLDEIHSVVARICLLHTPGRKLNIAFGVMNQVSEVTERPRTSEHLKDCFAEAPHICQARIHTSGVVVKSSCFGGHETRSPPHGGRARYTLSPLAESKVADFDPPFIGGFAFDEYVL